MALSNITRKKARSDLRSRLNEYTDEKFSNGELNHWINMGQYDVFNRLGVLTDIWFGTSKTDVDISSQALGDVNEFALPTGALATDVAKITTIIGQDISAIDGRVIPQYPLRNLWGFPHNSNWEEQFAFSHYGENLYFFWGSSSKISSTGVSGTVDIYYIRKPVELSTDTDTVDIPTEFVDLVIMYALSRALGKLGLTQIKQEVDQDISERFNEINKMYANEIALRQAEAAPGLQGRANV